MKPGIAAGVAVAGFAGMTLAGRGMPGLWPGALCTLCILAAAMGSAILNVVLEAGTDSMMPRVAARTSALYHVGKKPATLLSLSLITAGVAVSYAYINAVTAILIFIAALSYVALYTMYLKKRSPFGTVLGGIPGALPVLIGYSAVRPGLGVDGVMLFSVMLLWQPPHFLALALKYKDEYAAAGLPVMPVMLGEPYTKAFMFIYASALPVLTSALWIFGFCSGLFALFAFLIGCLYIAASYICAVRAKLYGRAFAASIAYIILLLAGVVADAG